MVMNGDVESRNGSVIRICPGQWKSPAMSPVMCFRQSIGVRANTLPPRRPSGDVSLLLNPKSFRSYQSDPATTE